MSNKTIAKFLTFVIFTIVSAILFPACSRVASETPKSGAKGRYSTPQIVGKVRSRDIVEASGLAASRCQNDVYWTHNDSGDGPIVFALNGKGESLGAWTVTGASNVDWEDIATMKDSSGKCFIYIAEIGDNKIQRPEHMVYTLAEPVVGPDSKESTAKRPMSAGDAVTIRFRYPDQNQNAETLMVHPVSGDIYVVTKRISGPAGIYRIPKGTGTAGVAEKIGELAVPAVPNGLLTGGDISPDGTRLILCDYSQGYEYTLPVGSKSFDDIWKQEPEVIDIGKRDTGEAICYTGDGSALLAVSEGINQPLIRVPAANEKGQP